MRSVRRSRGAGRSRLVMVGLVVVALACSRSGVTARRLEGAVAVTFANLIHVQEPILGGPPVDAASLRSSASCLKIGSGSDLQGGAGTWRCTISWFIPGQPGPVRDTYDLSVATDGCYTATADGSEAHVGGPTLKTSSGATVANLLYAFDGCFDPTARE